ncbi:AAA family ATPase [Altererythrobacter sp. H2]|uniref:AAA family ATPase n=1 Tax=Altererythrobacter sp. H2 TaxID=3108391 RepID=UPI002B4C1E49|nr:AAA family ATPase [Altererythrobacter sp. H2]WRK94308.1 AAA family ATPase [Altererythrobacter sp. H2]
MTLLGHEDAWNQWRAAMAGPRMHHGWLLAGKRGLGKTMFGLAAARELVAEPGVTQPKGDHPDILLLSHPPKDEKEAKKRDEGKPFELKRNIPVDLIRAMQQRLATRPTLGSRRVVIIDPADDMEKGAANALLKSLEEPPQGTFFLLVAHQPARLLPTIRSRCRVLRFSGLPDDTINRWLAEAAPDADVATRKAAVAAAAGSPGAALAFVGQELGKVDVPIRRILSQGDPDFSLRGQLAGEIGGRPSRERVQAILELARAVVADEAGRTEGRRLAALIEAHSQLVTLAGQVPVYNFDPGLLAMEIGTLLANAATASERADV